MSSGLFSSIIFLGVAYLFPYRLYLFIIPLCTHYSTQLTTVHPIDHSLNHYWEPHGFQWAHNFIFQNILTFFMTVVSKWGCLARVQVWKLYSIYTFYAKPSCLFANKHWLTPHDFLGNWMKVTRILPLWGVPIKKRVMERVASSTFPNAMTSVYTLPIHVCMTAWLLLGKERNFKHFFFFGAGSCTYIFFFSLAWNA